METHVQHFLKKFMPAFDLFREGARGTQSAKTPRDIESGLTNLTQPQSQNATDAVEEFPQSHSTVSLKATNRPEDFVDLVAANTDSYDDVEQEEPSQPQFTDGPSRFILAKDGSKSCVALLVNESFLARIRDMIQEDRDLNALDEPLCHAKTDLQIMENSIQEGQNALETAVHEEEAEEYRKDIEQQTCEVSRLRRWKNDLEKERGLIKGNLELSRNHTQWVMETAMREADLLGPEKPLPAILLREKESENTEDEAELTEQRNPAESPVASVTSDNSEVEVSQEKLQRREAYAEYIERLQFLDTVQEKFDTRGSLYRENLAEYQEMVAAGTTNMSRSEFDRRKVRYGQQLTRALIDAEEEFDEARENAQAIGALNSEYGQEFHYGAEYEESWPENKIAEYNASCDWNFINDWMDNIPDSTSQADLESVEIDEWEAEEVDVNDSISMIDNEDYRQDINRYRRICARLEDPCPEVRLLGQPDARPLERRHSFWM